MQNIDVENLNMIIINNHIHIFITHMFSIYDKRDICLARIFKWVIYSFLNWKWVNLNEEDANIKLNIIMNRKEKIKIETPIRENLNKNWKGNQNKWGKKKWIYKLKLTLSYIIIWKYKRT